jgi:hypothetical protein
MKRVLIGALALLAAPAAGHAQSDPNCMARAAVARDICLRDAARGGYSDRNCYSNYVGDTSRCRTRPVIRPRVTPRPQPKPNSPVKPVYPRVNPQ